MTYGRSRKQVKIDQEQFYDEMELHKPRASAERAFRHKAYSVEECLKNWGVDTEQKIKNG